MAARRTSRGSGGTIKKQRIRGKVRFCVITKGHKSPKGFKGKGSGLRFHGCFIKPTDAKRRLAKVSR